MEIDRWTAHFTRNSRDRAEPAWEEPSPLSPEVTRVLVRSLEQFHLGDGGGPAYLIAGNREGFLRGEAGAMRQLVDLWFAEEREHSRLLGKLVERFGGTPIQGHWSFTAFCATRRMLGVSFELTVLLLTEISSTAYYRVLRRHGRDPALRDVCRLILRDEGGHIAFHRSRLAEAGRAGRVTYGRTWEAWFRVLGWANATVLWSSHGRALRALGATRTEFYGELRRELNRFVRQLRRQAAPAVRPYAGAETLEARS